MDLHLLGKRIMLLHMLRRKAMQCTDCEKEIVPGQYPLLNYVSKHPGASQQALANMLFVTPASVAQSTKRLQHAGLLEKTSDPDNLRKNRLRVTRAGQNVVDSFHSLIDHVDDMTFQGFSEEELALLLNMHDRMIRNLATTGDLAILRDIELPNSCNDHTDSDGDGGNHKKKC